MRTAVYLRVSTNRQTQAQTIEQQLGKYVATSPLTKDSGYVDPLQSFSPVSSPNNHGLAIFQSRLKISGDIPRTGDDGSEYPIFGGQVFVLQSLVGCVCKWRDEFGV